jgi:hypothetical protein
LIHAEQATPVRRRWIAATGIASGT